MSVRDKSFGILAGGEVDLLLIPRKPIARIIPNLLCLGPDGNGQRRDSFNVASPFRFSSVIGLDVVWQEILREL
jgi:hypothetical protein